MTRNAIVLAALLVIADAVPCSASLTISKAATANMSCSNGLCVPTADSAILNVGDLQTMLSSGDLQINANGGKGANAKYIAVRAPFTWSTATTLTLTANSVNVQKKISIAGTGNLLLDVPYTLRFSFGPSGAIKFANLSSTLSIAGTNYQLVDTLAGLASAIAANPSGYFVLARSYNATADGTYTQSPVPTNFLGTFEGLGNTFSYISVNNTNACCVGGLFLSLSEALIFNTHLTHVNVVSAAGAAGFAYESFANIYSVTVTGTVTGGSSGDIGGIIGDDYGEIQSSYSTATVSAGANVTDVNVGGLEGVEFGASDGSFATGNVSAGDGSGNIGGLIGLISGTGADYCYATGAVTAGSGFKIGGLVGKNAGGGVSTCYSTGGISGGSGSVVGGFIGENDSTSVYYDYWDTTTSGTDMGVGLGNASNITGLTTEQLQSGLPPGFSRGWAEKSSINNGFPYLTSNPPPK